MHKKSCPIQNGKRKNVHIFHTNALLHIFSHDHSTTPKRNTTKPATHIAPKPIILFTSLLLLFLYLLSYITTLTTTSATIKTTVKAANPPKNAIILSSSFLFIFHHLLFCFQTFLTIISIVITITSTAIKQPKNVNIFDRLPFVSFVLCSLLCI